MYKIILSTIAVLLLLTQVAFGQTGAIFGQITDAETGQALPGAHVFLPDLNRGDVTDREGNFTISNLPAGTHALRISFVGYQTHTQNVEVGPGVLFELNVEMRVAAIRFDEMVVTGYATTPKRELTAAITTIQSREIQDIPLQNVEGLLQGRAAGVQVQSVSGNPGGAFRVQVRGQGSINAASEPLYIVDGVQISHSQLSIYASQSPLNSLNPSDIESIEILKDQAAAAIYGSQAASGVVIINTKRGLEGRTQVSARVERGGRVPLRPINYISTDQYLDFMAEARVNQGQFATHEAAREWQEDWFRGFFGTPIWTSEDMAKPFAERPVGPLANTNWYDDVITHTGATQKYSIAASGGDQTTRFYVSAGYESTESHLKPDVFERLNLRTNLDHRISSRFNASVNLNLARGYQFGICQDGNFINCQPSQAMFEAPMSFPYLADGEYHPWTRFGLMNNPVVIQNEVERDVTAVSIVGSANIDYRAADWLNVRGMIGLDYRHTEDIRYDSPIARPAESGFLITANRRVQNINANIVANARHTFGVLHNVSGLVGGEYRQDYSDFVSLTGQGFPGPFFKVYNAAADLINMAGSFGEFRIGSFFANAQYNYAEKYFINLVGRYDGHSRFGAEQRWGFFPSVSAAWRITEESFFDVGFITELKLRAGYGTAGNANIGNYAARGLYSAVGSYQGETGLTPTQLENVNLTWEESREINIGMDISFWEGRISAELDVFQRDNVELLFGRNLPLDSGFGSIIENIGKVRNEGFEISLNSVNLHGRDYSWSTRFNIGIMRNEVLELPKDFEGEFITINPNSFLSTIEVGRPLGVIFARKWAGVNPADGRPMWYDANGNITYTPSAVADADYYKDGFQNVTGGFGNTISFKGLSIDAFFEFNFGQWGFANTDWYFTRTPDFLMNLHEMVEDRWKQPGDITYIPRAATTGSAYPETADFRITHSTGAIYNASYIKLKNVTVSYSLPRSVTRTLNIGGLRLYATGANLLTWTAWPFYDPELAFDPTDIFGNITVASYPGFRQFSTGFEIQF